MLGRCLTTDEVVTDDVWETLDRGRVGIDDDDRVKGEGLSSARIYGETQAGGLSRLSILFADPEAYDLPVDPEAPMVARVWQGIVQGLGALVLVAAGVGAFGAFLLSRGKITMEEVE